MLKKCHFLNTFVISWTRNRFFLCVKPRLKFKLEQNVKHNLEQSVKHDLEPISATLSHLFKLEREAVNNSKNAVQHLEMLGFAWV